jgi:hypothetical protein
MKQRSVRMDVCRAVIATALLTASCGGSPAPSSAAATPAAQPGATPANTDAGHVHTAPHGGTLLELGEEFAHVELLLDSSAGNLTAYVLDGEAEKPVRLRQEIITLLLAGPDALAARPFDLRAVASVLTGETVGDSSQFALTYEGLKGVKAFSGTLVQLVVKGQEFRDVPVVYPSVDQRKP